MKIFVQQYAFKYWGIMVLLMWMGFLCISVFRVHAQDETTVLLSLDGRSNSGNITTIIAQINNAKDLYGYEIHLQFDPKMIEIEDSDPNKPGTQIKNGNVFNIDNSFLVINQADNEKGSIDYASTQLSPAPPFDGDGMLASIEVKSISSGENDLTINSLILSSPEGVNLPFVLVNNHSNINSADSESAAPIPMRTITINPTKAENVRYSAGNITATMSSNSHNKSVSDKSIWPTALIIIVFGTIIFLLFLIKNK